MLIPTCMVKLLEFTLVVACLVLHHYSYDLTDLPTLMLCSGTYVGYVIVLSGEIIAEAVSAAADVYIDAWWSASGAALFAACGGFTVYGWRDIPVCPRKKHAQAAAACALTVASVMLVESMVLLCCARKQDSEEGSTLRTKSLKTSRIDR